MNPIFEEQFYKGKETYKSFLFTEDGVYLSINRYPEKDSFINESNKKEAGFSFFKYQQISKIVSFKKDKKIEISYIYDNKEYSIILYFETRKELSTAFETLLIECRHHLFPARKRFGKLTPPLLPSLILLLMILGVSFLIYETNNSFVTCLCTALIFAAIIYLILSYIRSLNYRTVYYLY